MFYPNSAVDFETSVGPMGLIIRDFTQTTRGLDDVMLCLCMIHNELLAERDLQ